MVSDQLNKMPERNYVSYALRFFARSIRDIFSPMLKVESSVITLDPKLLQVWMVGHATTFINLLGATVLTDPLLVWALPPKRLMEPGYEANEFPHLNVVLVSHAHMDHFNLRSLKLLAAKTDTIIIPRNCSDLIKKIPFKNVIELDWEKSTTAHGLTVTAYKPLHWGKRYPWERIDRGYNCYIVEKDGKTVFFGGDTGYADHFKYIGGKHAIDLALLPISAYNPANLLRSHHMNPAEAHQAFLDLKSKHCIPIHWGSFRLALEPMSEPPKLFTELGKMFGTLDRIHLLYNGQSCSPLFEKELVTERIKE